MLQPGSLGGLPKDPHTLSPGRMEGLKQDPPNGRASPEGW